MARHAQVNSDTYKDLRQEGFSHKAIYVYLYYTITSENLIGLYRVIPEDDTVSMGYPAKDYKKAKAELEEKGKLVFREGWLWIPGKAKKVSGPKQIQAACKLLKELEAPQSLKAELAKKYPHLGYPIDGVSSFRPPIPIHRPIPISKKTSCSRNSKPEFLERVEKLKSLILQNNSSAIVKPNDWANNVRLMVERDKRTLEQIDAVIEWSQGNDFEKTNVLSMGKLRERFDSLTMKMKRAKRGRESNICPACRKLMADCFDHWYCGDCRQKHKKAE